MAIWKGYFQNLEPNIELRLWTEITIFYIELIFSATFMRVETLEWLWFCYCREHFLLIKVSEVGQTYQ